MTNGALIILSVPYLYLSKEDISTPTFGLMPPNSKIPDRKYAKDLITRLQGYMELLNFKDITVDERSPFEIYIHGKR